MYPSDEGRTRFRRPFTLLVVPGLLLGALAGCSNDSAGPSTPTVTPAIAWINLYQPVDLTPDGSIAAIQDLNGGGDLYFYHTATGALEIKTQVGDPGFDVATGISANGVVTAMHNVPVQAGFWTAASEWTDLPSSYPVGCDQNVAGAWDVSANGRSIVGLVWEHCNARAFRWDATGAGIMTPLQLLGESYEWSPDVPPTNRASVISDDGSTVAGFASTAQVDRYPAIWHADGTGFLIPGVPDGYPGEVMAISADGKVVAGSVGQDVFYWTEASGLVNIGQLPDADISWANAMSGDGKLIFGISGSPWFGVPHAFVWTQAEGMRRLDDVAKAAGVEITDDYQLTNVLAASQDGTVLLGQAWGPNFSTVTFVLHLPVSAYGL